MKDKLENIMVAIGAIGVISLFFFVIFSIGSAAGLSAAGTAFVQLLFTLLGAGLLVVFIIYLWATTVGIRDGQEWF